MAEKSINELSQDMRKVYTKGFEALQRDNADYAISLFTQILAREPAVFEIRKLLRAAQQTKSGASKGFFKRAMSSAGSQPLYAKGQLALRKNPLEAMQIAEEILNTDANSASGHKLLAEAAMAAQMPKEAVMSLEILVQNSPKDKELTYQLAEALAGAGERTKGEEALVALQRLYPTDAEISTRLKNLSANKTLNESYGKLADGSGSYRDVLRNKDEAVSLEQANRQVKTDDSSNNLIQDWEDRLEREPNNIKMLKNLAEVYSQRSEFDKSLVYYNRLVGIDGGADAALMRQIADVRIKKFNLALSQLDKTAFDYEEKSAQIKAERQAYQLEECRQRAERYPTDLQIKFELGQLYYDGGKITEAIQEFQKSQANPNRRVQSITYLAKCFEKRGMNDIAARRLQEVLKEKVSFDDEKKDLVYTLGCIFDKMGKKEEAIEQFKALYEIDIGYKDVAKRVDDYYAGGGT